MSDHTTTSMTLDQLQPGSTARVVALSSTGLNRRRMMDLGILPGTEIAVGFTSPMGNPTAYQVRGSLIALRQSQAREIQVTLDDTRTEGK